MNTKRLLDGIKCTGCFACYDQCHQNCISVDKDNNLFVQPKIDEEKCIDCAKCIRGCPERSQIEKNYPIRSFAAYLNEENIYERSSSGGVFAGLAKKFIQMGGVVCGAAYIPNEECVKHIMISRIQDITLIQGSKYVQSSTSGIYNKVRKSLRLGQKVLFSGTPCQVAALISMVEEKEKKYLYTVEVICHGVSNNDYLKKSIKTYLRNDTVIDDIRFRVKSKYEKSAFVLQLNYSDGYKKYISSQRDLYYRLYVDGKIYRESCYACRYATNQRVADITIGDCSTYKDYNFLNPNKALSTVVLNTDKANNYWEYCKNDFSYTLQDMKKEFEKNAQLSHPAERPENIQQIFDNYINLSNKELRSLYNKFDIRLEVVNLIKKLIPLKWRNKIRKVFSLT